MRVRQSPPPKKKREGGKSYLLPRFLFSPACISPAIVLGRELRAMTKMCGSGGIHIYNAYITGNCFPPFSFWVSGPSSVVLETFDLSFEPPSLFLIATRPTPHLFVLRQEAGAAGDYTLTSICFPVVFWFFPAAGFLLPFLS